jgi:thiosulfate/3-mercaptopyruvate sulfurtransferase
MSLAVCLLLSLNPQAGAYPRGELLIEPRDLIANLEKYRVLDVRAKAKYVQGHLPGAVWVDHDTWAATFAAKPGDLDTWARLLGERGISGAADVAVYDDGSTKDAARVWWILRYFKLSKVRLVNGGWHGLTEAKAPISTAVENPRPVEVRLLSADSERLADKAAVLDILKNKTGTQIIDTRSEKEYCGETRLAKRGGAVPGAIHLEWTGAIDPKTKRFKSADDLAKLLEEAGIDLKKKSVTHCQSGGRAAVMAFTLELMGANNVANYYRSWSEWGNDDKTPIVVPKRK